jgi:hypothetical protein
MGSYLTKIDQNVTSLVCHCNGVKNNPHLALPCRSWSPNYSVLVFSPYAACSYSSKKERGERRRLFGLIFVFLLEVTPLFASSSRRRTLRCTKRKHIQNSILSLLAYINTLNSSSSSEFTSRMLPAAI